MASSSGKTPLEHALSDGEDFELLLAVPPDATAKLIADQPLECGMTDVGEFVAEGGLQSRDAAGNVAPLAATGYEHH
jgi:thiamine-monophosphate kinase